MSATGPNVVLVVLDTARADAVGAGHDTAFAQLARDPAEVLEVVEQVAGGAVLLDEVVEVIERPPVRAESGRDREALPVGQVTDRVGPDRPLEVDVQLRLRQGSEVSHLPMVASRR